MFHGMGQVEKKMRDEENITVLETVKIGGAYLHEARKASVSALAAEYGITPDAVRWYFDGRTASAARQKMAQDKEHDQFVH